MDKRRNTHSLGDSMHDVKAKGILSANNGMNLYRGCTHGCIYCDSRSACYRMDHPFEDVAVKINAPELLEAALKRKRSRCMIGTGAMCDPYMHCEEDLRLTRKCLEIIYRYGFGVTVQTKSTRILRDIDLLGAIHERSKAVVQMTLTTFDESLCRLIEPNVSGTRQRYEALKAFQGRAIPTVVWLSPFLPFINDQEENLQGLLEYCFDSGVKGIICFGFGVTMREGNREYFYKMLDRHFPGMKEKYIKTFGNDYVCTSPNHAKLMSSFQERCEKHGVLYDIGDVFSYLADFTTPRRCIQTSFFDGTPGETEVQQNGGDVL